MRFFSTEGGIHCLRQWSHERGSWKSLKRTHRIAPKKRASSQKKWDSLPVAMGPRALLVKYPKNKRLTPWNKKASSLVLRSLAFVPFFGSLSTEGGTRTHTRLLSLDFESNVSTNSTTSAGRAKVHKNSFLLVSESTISTKNQQVS